MKAVEKKDIKALLAEAKRFCNGIVAHVDTLGLSQKEINTFTVDVELLRYIVDHDEQFTESFISYNAISIQWRLTDLVTACTVSNKFNAAIANELGIKFPLNDTRGLTNMQLKWSNENTYNPGTK
ncbi:MAG TPA: hypothetical protein VK154_18395 [Chitinophagales bacterium]|nr:hypothetical protein [Chitinophagales bacterium]